MLDTIVGRSPTHKEHIQSWACLEARSRPGEPSYPLPAGFIRRWLLDRGSSATHHRSGGHQPAHQSMINRRLMIVPPAMPSSGRTEQLDERERNSCACCLKWRCAQSRAAAPVGPPAPGSRGAQGQARSCIPPRGLAPPAKGRHPRARIHYNRVRWPELRESLQLPLSTGPDRREGLCVCARSRYGRHDWTALYAHARERLAAGDD